MSNEPEKSEETNAWAFMDEKEPSPKKGRSPAPVLHEEGVLNVGDIENTIVAPTLPLEEAPEVTVEEDLGEAQEVPHESFEEEIIPPPIESDYVEPTFSGYDDNIAIHYKPSLLGQAWDILPVPIRKKIHAWGYAPPIDAVKQSLLGPLRNGEAMIIGPMMAGKTTFVGAIQQACLLTKVKPNIDYVLHFNPAKEEETNNVSLQDLINQNIHQMLRGGRETEATEFVAQYKFNVKGNVNRGNRPQIFDLGCSFFDNPGEVMFPKFEDMEKVWEERAEQRDEMLQKTEDSRILILFFDSTKRYTALLRILLPKILGAIRGDKRTISAKRVLIMLNKVDTFANAVSIQNKRIGLTPKQVAESLDPLMLLRRCIGFANLSMFFDYMKPEAELAVSLVSTTGFQENGYPLFDHKGNSMIQTNEKISTDNDKAECWDPYGIYESLVFLATGKISKRNMALVDRYNIGNRDDE